MGSSPDGTTIISNGDGMEFHQGKLFFTDKIIDRSNTITTEPSKVAEANSVLLCVRAPVGEVNITNRQICIGRGLSSIHPTKEIDVDFLFYWLQTYKQYLNIQATGSTFVAITADVIKTLLIPLPPIDEQKVIKKTIDISFAMLNDIEKSLS